MLVVRAWIPASSNAAWQAAADPAPEQSRFQWMDWDGEKRLPSGGGWMDDLDKHAVFRVGRRRAGRLLDRVEHNASPEIDGGAQA
jgi:hypothetical protein